MFNTSELASTLGISDGFAEASDHSYNCICPECADWWRSMGADPDSGLYGPFGEKLPEGKDTVYVALWEDRHADATVHLFSEKEAAIEWARGKAKVYDRHGDFEEQEIHGWEYYVKYSCEGDSIRVVKREIDADTQQE